MKYLKSILLLAASLVLILQKSEEARGAETNNSDRVVVMISVDGLAGFYLDDPKAEMPNIRALAAEGARAAGMKASTPSVTWPNHTTLVTGVTPAIHGVVGNNYYDRSARRTVTLIWDPTFDKDEIVKVPTIYDMAKSNGLKTAAIRWPASRNAKSLDWTIPDSRWGSMTKKYSTPSLIDEVRKAGIFSAKENAADEIDDETCVHIFNLILEKHRPQLALLHLLDVDHTQHSKGPRSAGAYAAIKTADAQVGEVWEELKRDFPGKATLFVVSDHGFSPIKKIILPNVILRQAGLTRENSPDNPIQIVSQGGSALVYVLDEARRKMLLQKSAQAFRQVSEIADIVGTEHLKDYGMAVPKNDPHAPDMILFAKQGYVFGDTAAGELAFEDKPERLGSHGHNPALPDLHATFVAWGAGIKTGVRLGEIENTRVAPTLAKLLGVSLPNVKSRPLTKILKK
ncbi:MAG: ectonucleotide pyrophosphatase/phosphodiesterase [Verrucomicrobiota bacterium]